MVPCARVAATYRRRRASASICAFSDFPDLLVVRTVSKSALVRVSRPRHGNAGTVGSRGTGSWCCAYAAEVGQRDDRILEALRSVHRDEAHDVVAFLGDARLLSVASVRSRRAAMAANARSPPPPEAANRRASSTSLQQVGGRLLAVVALDSANSIRPVRSTHAPDELRERHAATQRCRSRAARKGVFTGSGLGPAWRR